MIFTGRKQPQHQDPIPVSVLYQAAMDDALALANEAADIARHLDAVARVKAHTLTDKRNKRAYRRFLKSRLKAIRKAQRNLCSLCYGTGEYNDQHLVYRECPSCRRMNLNYPTII